MATGLSPGGPLVPAPGEVDWSAPWLQPLRAQALPLVQALGRGQPVWQALDAAAGAAAAPVRFVAQEALPPGQAYEAYIRAHAAVPTREGWHDFLNGLIWLHFPATKLQLNALHSQVIAAQGVGSVRGALRDACTLFDENAALLQGPDVLWETLCRRDWPCLFGELRPLWREVRVTLFGHALIEKLLQPRKDITAHVLRVPAHVQPTQIDGWLAATLSAEALAAKPFQPLPVLGIPGWWTASETADFYKDPRVFRPSRTAGDPLHPAVSPLPFSCAMPIPAVAPRKS